MLGGDSRSCRGGDYHIHLNLFGLQNTKRTCSRWAPLAHCSPNLFPTSQGNALGPSTNRIHSASVQLQDGLGKKLQAQLTDCSPAARLPLCVRVDTLSWPSCSSCPKGPMISTMCQ